MLPTVDFCGLQLTRLLIGANPFGGFSHQTRDRNEAMRAYHTPARILETWSRAEASGINTMVTNNESPNVMEAVRAYLGGGGGLQWIAQVAMHSTNDMIRSIDTVVEMGCKAVYIHGDLVDGLYDKRDESRLRAWLDHARSLGVPAGVAGHSPATHRWVYELGAADFHVVCFFRCGSVHRGEGLRFKLEDLPRAAECVRAIAKPCIGYKIMAAGRIDAQMAFEYAFTHIKPTDVVNVGMHRGDKDDMVEENAAIVRGLLGA
ncbi:MAG: hypothetical protein JXR37_32375 [Kiritimatiellae bacterium]|nr:hypothetical protein [Kiritimatiellia bacterium]